MSLYPERNTEVKAPAWRPDTTQDRFGIEYEGVV